jgi:hypothetical protein
VRYSCTGRTARSMKLNAVEKGATTHHAAEAAAVQKDLQRPCFKVQTHPCTERCMAAQCVLLAICCIGASSPEPRATLAKTGFSDDKHIIDSVTRTDDGVVSHVAAASRGELSASGPAHAAAVVTELPAADVTEPGCWR